MLTEVRRWLLWGPPILWMALIFHSSSQSDPAPAVTSIVWDKALHLGGYAVLALLFARALRAEGLGPLGVAIGAVLLTSLYGASDEVHQMFTPMRESDIRDWMADTIGAAIGSAAFIVATKARRNKISKL